MPDYRLVYGDELMHYGVKGMKWGRRRYQNKDGSLTIAGKKRYGDEPPVKSSKLKLKIPKNKSKHRQNLEAKYIQSGMSKDEAEQAAAKRIRTEKYVAAAAGVTVAACASYLAYRRYAVDKTVSSSQSFQRIMKMKPDQTLTPGPMYMSYKKRDNIKYEGLLGKTFHDQTAVFDPLGNTQVVKFKMKPDQDVKVASPKRAKDTFERLYKENKEFRKVFEQSSKEMSEGLGPTKAGKMIKDVVGKPELKGYELRSKGYDAFNIGLVNKSQSGTKAANIFYEELKKQGINAVQDINDIKYSGYKSKNPLIVFDSTFDYERTKLGYDQIKKSFDKSIRDLQTEEAIKQGSIFVASYGGAVVAGKVALDKINENNTRR